MELTTVQVLLGLVATLVAFRFAALILRSSASAERGRRLAWLLALEGLLQLGVGVGSVRAAVESALEDDGRVDEKGRAILDRLRTKLGLAAEDARAVEAEVLPAGAASG